MTEQTVGSLYETHCSTSPFTQVTFRILHSMVLNPASTPKTNTQYVSPTTAAAKTKTAILGHNQMTLGWVDIDHGNLALQEVVNIATAHGIHHYLVYSTASATPEDLRWRMLINLPRPMDCAEWQLLQEALATVFCGDISATRITQGFYAPTSPNGFYEHHVCLGQLLNPDNLPVVLQAAVDKIKIEREALLETARKAPKAFRNVPNQDKGIIGLVNGANDIETVLECLGFDQCGINRWRHPDSKSGRPGAVLLENEQGELRYYSHHSQETDPLADGHSHDVFDILCQYQFDGDIGRAVAHYAEELDPDGQRQRRREFAVMQEFANVRDSFPELASSGDIHSIAPAIVDWPHENGNGGPRNTLINFQHMLNCFKVNCRYNVISKCVELIFPGMSSTIDNAKNMALIYMTSLAGLNGFPQKSVRDYVLATADQNPFNPILAFINSRPWDGIPRIWKLIETIQPEPGFSLALARLLVWRWLISAVAAIAKPQGFHSRGVLVLSGAQGIGKTSWFRRLLPDEIQQYFKEGALLDPANKDTLLTALAHWIVELGELDATFRKADIARLKSFITQSEDKIRRPYGYVDSEYQRRTVFCASVNETDFLVDPTGNSRFWVIPVIDLNYQHQLDMQQVWAEVYQKFLAGERWWLDAAEEKMLDESNVNFRQVDAIEELLRKHFEDISEPYDMKLMTATEILQKKLMIKEPSKSQLQTAGKVLTELGFPLDRTNKRRQRLVPVSKFENI